LLATLATIVKWAILLPVFLAIVLLAVANDQSVTVHLNPFDAEDPMLRVDLALYQVAFILFALGVLVGGIVAWNSQRRALRRARAAPDAAPPWQPRAGASFRRPAEPAAAARAGRFLPRPERG
jgi:hypothetical protein